MANWWEDAPLVTSRPQAQPKWWEAAPLAAPAQRMEGGVPVGGAPGVTVQDAARPGTIPAGQPQAPGTDPVSVADHGMRMIANGMTFNMADRAAGVADVATGRADSYDEGARGQRAQTQAIREAAPLAAGMAEAAGGIMGGLGLMRAGVTMAGRVGPGLIPRMGAYGIEGAGYGAAHGAGSTYSDDVWDYAGNAWESAKLGGIVGAGLPAAGSGISALFRGGQAVVGPRVEGMGRMASTFLRGGALADEQAMRNLPNMGPEAMMVDAGPSMLGLGQGAGTGIGPGRTMLVQALRERDASTGQRLAATLDDNLGPAPVPSQIREGLDESRRAIGARYGEMEMRSTFVDPGELAGALDAAAFRLRGPAQAAVKRVRGYLNQEGRPGSPAPRDIDGNPALASDAETLFETRQAIDGLLAGEVDPKVVRELTIARQGVDDLLAGAVPGIKQADGAFREIARQDEALTRGGQVFDKGKTATRPSELATEMQEGALPQGEMVGPSGAPYRMRQGARAELDRLVGTNVNDLGTLERTLATPQDWNSQKFGALFGEPQRDAVVDALLTNRRFRQSYQDIVQGSQTAQRNAAQRSMDGELDVPFDTTVTGIAANSAKAIGRYLMGMSSEATKDEIGRALSAKGEDMRRIVDALLRQAAVSQARGQAVGRAVGSPALAGGAGNYAGRRDSR